MEPLLTLVIARCRYRYRVGAIWTAAVTRHPARAGRKKASLNKAKASTNRTSVHWLTLEYDLLSRMSDRFSSPHYFPRQRN